MKKRTNNLFIAGFFACLALMPILDYFHDLTRSIFIGVLAVADIILAFICAIYGFVARHHNSAQMQSYNEAYKDNEAYQGMKEFFDDIHNKLGIYIDPPEDEDKAKKQQGQ